MMKLLRTSLALISLLIMPILAAAETEVGHVVWVRGQFHAGSRLLQRLSPIYLHEVLTTGANSMAEIAFTDNTLMTFKDNSRYSIDGYKMQPASESNFTGRLIAGGFRTLTGLIAKNNPHHYMINTPVASLGVRGTDYQAILDHGYLYVAVYHGTVCITPEEPGTPNAAPCPCGLYALMKGEKATIPNYKGEG